MSNRASDSEPTADSDPRAIDTLLAVVARLRDPEHGCPWDLKQTPCTIVPYTLEEAYEVAEAIANDDMAEFCEELGDLLFQIVLYARMAQERGAFDFGDVVSAIARKMIRRHPHVFGEARLADDQAVREHWESIKAAERAGKGEQPRARVLDGVARALPALVRAEKLQKRAARVGFDWDDLGGVADKVREELAECEATFPASVDPAERLHEVGDLLFSCVNLARHLGVDAEQALRVANERFEHRFGHVESQLRDAGLEPAPEHRDAMERLWTQVKADER
ncbi:nucleoside triphosphate pyrophosphohydrolase [Thiohalocapsa marina]|uniref:Nucleoside triphosphate pyrophosphohydrolase n=1 Tax=Thiohalocapsa marina TaxID=424902 RepID=A0A5M8FJT9_9GAMM|nr:nucleoside triphosphate pyrophosphohydrolase [Thiohalocapsa marina]KAA6184969.1 nucleoside triphosphate pyrophosphohydrolase [Thiohalocapsa marina]